MITILENKDNNPFRTDSTDVSYYDDFLDPKELDYLQKAKNRTGEIVYMTPETYFEHCAKYIFNGRVSVDDLKQQRSNDTKAVDYYKKLMQDGVKFYLPYLNYADDAQEGLHRMLCAGDLYGWDTKFPVLIVTVFDPDRETEEEAYHIANKFKFYYMDKIVEDTLWQNYNREDISDTSKWKIEFCELLTENALDAYEENLSFDCEFDKSDPDTLSVSIVGCNGFVFNDKIISKSYYLPDIVSSVNYEPEHRSMPDNLEALDLDDLDLSDDALLKFFFK